MPASQGTPTIWQKIGAIFGQGGTTQAATLAGDERDAATLLADLEGLFGPTVVTLETDGLAAVTAFLKEVLSVAPITSLSTAISAVKTAATTAGGTLLTQIESLGEQALTTLISAALTALGKVVPVA